MLAGDGWSDDGGSIVVGNAGISDGDGGEKAHKLQKGSTKRECGGGLGRVWLDEYEIRFTVPSPKKKLSRQLTRNISAVGGFIV